MLAFCNIDWIITESEREKKLHEISLRPSSLWISDNFFSEFQTINFTKTMHDRQDKETVLYSIIHAYD
jgi:hypothetical protein